MAPNINLLYTSFAGHSQVGACSPCCGVWHLRHGIHFTFNHTFTPTRAKSDFDTPTLGMTTLCTAEGTAGAQLFNSPDHPYLLLCLGGTLSATAFVHTLLDGPCSKTQRAENIPAPGMIRDDSPPPVLAGSALQGEISHGCVYMRHATIWKSESTNYK